MKSSTVFALSSVSFLAAMALVPGCSDDATPSSSSSSSGSPGDDAGDGAVTIRDLGAPNIPCNDSADSIYADPGALPATKGAIIKCHEDPVLSSDALQKRLDELGYKGKALTSGARVYRVLYRTERGDAANTAGTSSALVYVPTTPRANDLPVVVASRGTRGQGGNCAASKRSVPDLDDDLDRLAYSTVGSGYAVIVPDLAGYANFKAAGNPPSAYAQAADVGKSTLDGSRALKTLYPRLSGKTVLIGHSQGGHTALAALALSDSYGIEGSLVGVAVYAPLWLSQRTWGAIIAPAIAQSLTPPATIDNQPGGSIVSVLYHYTQAELLDGPGEGEKLFRSDVRAAIKQYVETDCFGPPAPLKALGATYAYELFEPALYEAVGDAAAGIGTCNGKPALCEKWLSRYVNDRPHITGKAAQVPLLVLWGGQDTTIPASRLRCAVDRLVSDGTKLSLCYDPALGHQTILDEKSSYVGDWIGNVALGEPAPAACAGGIEAVTEQCGTPPPND